MAATFTVFHGTATEFDAFDMAFGGENTSYRGADRAVFFAKSKADAAHYGELAALQHNERAVDDEDAVAILLTVEVTVENPFVVGMDTEVDGLDLDDDDAVFDYAEENDFDAVIFEGGNFNNAGWTIAIFDADAARITARS